ncbi:MAG TPA: arginase family protein [Allosphingosinicella sp.]
MAWRSIADLLGDKGEVTLLGAPMEAGSVTPGRCDLAPETLRRALKRFSTYDLVTGTELDPENVGQNPATWIRDAGDLPVRGLTPAEGFEIIRDGVRKHTNSGLNMLIGGNNAVTRPAAHGLPLPLEKVGVITLDAHFDMRDTKQGPINGNPISCLLDDGLPGANLCQIGLAPFANTYDMEDLTEIVGSRFWTIADCKARGIATIIGEAFERLAHLPILFVDFDIDVIDGAQLPGAPGARPGGMPVDMFFEAARHVAAHPKVRLVDLTEFDPSLDVSDISALTAGRWVCEILAGYSMRAR